MCTRSCPPRWYSEFPWVADSRRSFLIPHLKGEQIPDCETDIKSIYIEYYTCTFVQDLGFQSWTDATRVAKKRDEGSGLIIKSPVLLKERRK